MCRAAEVARSGEMGYLKASKYFSVSAGTIQRYVKNTSRSPEELANVHLGRSTVLPNGLVNKLVQNCIAMTKDTMD